MTFPLLINAGGAAIANGVQYGTSEDIYLGSAGYTYTGSTIYRKRYLYRQGARNSADDDRAFTTYATTVLVVDGAIL